MKMNSPPNVILHSGRINTCPFTARNKEFVYSKWSYSSPVKNVSEAQRSDKTLVIDLNGHRVIPGLNDPETKFPEYVVPTKTAAHA